MKADFCIYLKGFRSSFSSGTHFMLSGENFQPQRLVFWSARSAAAHFWGRVSESSGSRNWKLQRPLQSWEVTSDLHCSAIWFSWQPNKNRMSFFFFFFLFKSFFNINSLQTEKSCLSSFAHESFLWFSFILWWQRSASVWLPSCWCQPRDTCSPRLSRFCMIQEP